MLTSSQFGVLIGCESPTRLREWLSRVARTATVDAGRRCGADESKLVPSL
jgi:hypothetical protein